MLIPLLIVNLAARWFALADAAGTGTDADIANATVTALNDVLTVKLKAPQGLFNLISWHMDLDNPIKPPQQGGIASVDLKPDKYYKSGEWTWQVNTGKGANVDVKGKTIYYWVRVEENGKGINSPGRSTKIA